MAKRRVLTAAGIYEAFYHLVENAGLTAFVEDKCPQYLLLTNIFVQSFNFYPRKNPPMVDFKLYDIPVTPRTHLTAVVTPGGI